MTKKMEEFYVDRDDLLDRFGTVVPTVEQRLNEYEFLWFLFGEASEVRVKGISSDELMDERKRLGPFNVISRHNRIRFRNEADQAYFKLKYG